MLWATVFSSTVSVLMSVRRPVTLWTAFLLALGIRGALRRFAQIRVSLLGFTRSSRLLVLTTAWDRLIWWPRLSLWAVHCCVGQFFVMLLATMLSSMVSVLMSVRRP